ncbi:MAG: MotA/TolQ/ExbB proton channel family protein [Byssovorax sp.]
MKVLSQLLLIVSNALLVPDLIAAFLLMLVALIEIGLISAALVHRMRSERATRELIDRLSQTDEAARRAAVDAYLSLDPVPSGLVFRLALLGERARLAPVRELCVEETQNEVDRHLGRLMFCIRLGPMVGLVGTLIPLGPGLVALAQGDLTTMASHMTVAFTVTVVGLSTGALGFVVASIRRTSSAREIARLSFVADTIAALAPPVAK